MAVVDHRFESGRAAGLGADRQLVRLEIVVSAVADAVEMHIEFLKPHRFQPGQPFQVFGIGDHPIRAAVHIGKKSGGVHDRGADQLRDGGSLRDLLLQRAEGPVFDRGGAVGLGHLHIVAVQQLQACAAGVAHASERVDPLRGDACAALRRVAKITAAVVRGLQHHHGGFSVFREAPPRHIERVAVGESEFVGIPVGRVERLRPVARNP